MELTKGSSSEVYVAIRASRRVGLFDLVTISDMGGGAEDAILMLDLTDIELLSTRFWPDQDWRERLRMLKHGSPTSIEQWLAAQSLAGNAYDTSQSAHKQ